LRDLLREQYPDFDKEQASALEGWKVNITHFHLFDRDPKDDTLVTYYY
jgi:hypothetical protein